MSDPLRCRPDGLRRLATELLSRVGLDRERASAFGRSLLWYDAIGAHEFGISSLSDWLSRIERGEFDPKQCGRVGPEHGSTAVMEGLGGLPPLLLVRAAEIAGQKARDTGVGLVRVLGLPPSTGPSAAIAAELAIGPYAGAVLGPGSAQASAFPSAEGVPVVFDSHFARPDADVPESQGPVGMMLDRLAPWVLLAGAQEVLVAAVAVAAFESLGSFHARVAEAIESRIPPSGWIFPRSWQSQRLESQQRGVPLQEPSVSFLRERCSEAGIDFPGPIR
ncbi:Ldh family oxidoreductase [Tautonia plasticadhaerens]|uniref:Malate/L-lactate dehydrogenase n=1 Tax=Tautonia plasticadhaerens TaxID=2527974 RepID=A0A518GY20_9BACT|nr:Ldh family oxidoreductase [Tautonia plasticadhaerens]QDV33490.1 Malate/L-lactate dehydrogenase [Tautonia plasticadhaerens]